MRVGSERVSGDESIELLHGQYVTARQVLVKCRRLMEMREE